MSEISPRGEELRAVYESANSDYWTNVASPIVQEWIDNGQDEQERPNVMGLMDSGREHAWNAVAHRAESWSK